MNQRPLLTSEESAGAAFSACRRYRYRLWRSWNEKLPTMLFLMLNPSTADELVNDPTVERCQRRAVAAGFGRLEVANIFAYRSTDPRKLYAVDDPIGPANDAEIAIAVRSAALVVCAWGKHGAHLGRGKAVLEMIRQAGGVPHALRLNGDGSPAHPLYIGYDVKPEPIE